MSYETGAQVLYGIHGVCTIVSRESIRFGKERTEYYVLQPLAQPDSRFYVPVNNPAAVAKIQELLSREALTELLHAPQSRQNVWVPEENQRKVQFREILAKGERSQILSMIYCLYKHRDEQLRLGRKFHQSDEAFLKDAQKLMNAEISHVMEIPTAQVGEFIRKTMQE